MHVSLKYLVIFCPTSWFILKQLVRQLALVVYSMNDSQLGCASIFDYLLIDNSGLLTSVNRSFNLEQIINHDSSPYCLFVLHALNIALIFLSHLYIYHSTLPVYGPHYYIALQCIYMLVYRALLDSTIYIYIYIYIYTYIYTLV